MTAFRPVGATIHAKHDDQGPGGEGIGFLPDVERVPVFGLCCAGGMAGLAIGTKMARATPGSKVLVVAVELCSVAFRMDKLTKENIAATALFADGTAVWGRAAIFLQAWKCPASSPKGYEHGAGPRPCSFTQRCGAISR